MTHFRIFTAVALAAGAVAISPSIAQDRGGRAMGGAPSAGAAASAPRAAPATPALNAAAGTNMRTSQMNTVVPGGTWQGHSWNGGRTWNGGTWNGGRVATNNWNGNWNGYGGDFDRDHRSRRGPGFAFGFGAGFGAPYYDDYAYAGYPYNNAYYNDPYYSDTFAYDTGPSVAVTVAPGADDPAYCAQRFRSYDPASGTYLGFDGMRHPCP